jgi:PAS domain S-box-containing protein
LRRGGPDFGANWALANRWPGTEWIISLGCAVGVAIAYFLAAQFGLALLADEVAVFWPASGIAVGILVVMGPRACGAVVIGVVVATIIANLMGDRSLWASVFKGFCNAGEAVLMAWLIERWFGRPFAFDDIRHVLGFVAAAVLGPAASAFGGAATMTLLHTAAPFWDVWRIWFLASGVGILVVAPLLIGLGQLWTTLPSRAESVEGVGILILVLLVSWYAVAHPTGSWLSFDADAVVFPLLLWLTARCQPLFGLAGAFIWSITAICATAFGVGHFGDATVLLTERVNGARVTIALVTLCTLVLTALFTERRRSEAALKLALLTEEESGTRLADAMAAGRVMAFEWDNITGLSRRDDGAHILGLEQGGMAKVANSNFLEHVHPDDRARLKAQIRGLRPDNPSYAWGFRFRRPDGREVWLEETARGELDASGRLLRVKGLTRDITERKRTEGQLAEREAQLRLFVEHTPAAIAVFDREMRYLAVSRRFAIDFRLPPDTQLIGKSHYEVFPEVPEHWRDIHARVLAGEELSNDEDQFTRQDGRTEWTGWSMAPWRGGDGRIGGAILFAEVRTEQVEARRALADSEARFRATFENAAVGVARVGTDGSILRANKSFARMLGYSVEELTTRTFQDVTHPDDLANNISLLNKTLVGETESYCIEKRYVRKDGGIVWASLTVGCVRKTDGCVDYFVSVVQDITERKRVEEQQRTLLAELDHRVKNALATVSAVVSHTQQESRSVADFVAALDGRIRSMATTHELLSSHRWQGVSLSELVRRELAPYATCDNTEIKGPGILLKPEAGQAMAMVLHELATNAAKYGALSTKNGRVSIRWDRCLNGHPRPDLVFEWQEIGGPPVVALGKSSYGTSTIRELIPYELGGTVDLVPAPEGVRCRLIIPADWIGRR